MKTFNYDTKNLGPNLIRLRATQGLSQEKLAEGLSVSRAQLANVETGRSGMNLRTFVETCNRLGVSPDTLLMGNGDG